MFEKFVLVTGGCGFIGSHFVDYYLKNNPDLGIINLDNLTYAGNICNTERFKNNKRYKFIKGNIRNYELLYNILDTYKIKKVINFAAESHVDNSIKNPDIFLQSNVDGTLQVIKACYHYWMKDPNIYKDGFEDTILLHVSTDEVYGTLSIESNESFNEDSNYKPNSPYSASKASSELFVRSFHRTYGLNAIITSCSNNYGEFQHFEKLIPHTITNILKNTNITIHGNGKNIRDWLYVRDHCEALSLLLDAYNVEYGSKYNIGADNEISNLSVVSKICKIMDDKLERAISSNELITFVSDRPANDLRYSVDYRKIKRDFNWEPKTKFEEGLSKTIDHYIDFYNKKSTKDIK